MNDGGGIMNIFQVDKDILKLDYKYVKMIEKMKEEVTSFCEEFNDTPENPSDWGHNYFCKEDGERLIFDLHKPQEHECKFCHRIYKSEKLDRVWTYFYRNEAILTLMKLAVLYRAYGEDCYLTEFKRILWFYADNYTKFDIHAKDKIVEEKDINFSGAGRIMPQELNESVIIVRIMIALEILKEDLDVDFIKKINDIMLLNAVKILKPQIYRIHNKSCWLNAAIGAVGLYTHDQELIDFVLHGEFSINEQLRQGVTKDKFWYEGSVHYNFFLLEGITYLLAFCKAYNQELEEENVVKDMLIQSYQYAFENNLMPNPNDGWPNVNLKSYEYVYCLAAKLFGEGSELENIYKHITADKKERVPFPLSQPYYYNNDVSFERLVCLPNLDVENRTPVERKSVCYKDSYYAMLRNKRINLFMKYGHRGPSHAHPDKMNIEVMIDQKILSRELSNSGYASRLCNGWHRKTLSHNTVVVDGKDHTSVDGGQVIKFDQNSCHTFVKDVYDGINYARNIDLEEEKIRDEFQVESMEVHTYDWIFHCEGNLQEEPLSEAGNLGFETNGYEYLMDVKKLLDVPAVLELEWNLEDTNLISSIDTVGKEIYLAKTYDNPASTFRTAIILREKADTAKFNVSWNIL